MEDKRVFLSRQKGLSAQLKRDLKRKSAIESHIGHMKADGKLGRNDLKGKVGDIMNALLSAVGHNLRLILNYLREAFCPFCGQPDRVVSLLRSLFFPF